MLLTNKVKHSVALHPSYFITDCLASVATVFCCEKKKVLRSFETRCGVISTMTIDYLLVYLNLANVEEPQVVGILQETPTTACAVASSALTSSKTMLTFIKTKFGNKKYMNQSSLFYITSTLPFKPELFYQWKHSWFYSYIMQPNQLVLF